MSTALRLSVIIPTFRRFEPLLATLDDVLRQDYPDFEVVVADQNGAWPAEFADRVESIKRDRRVRWIDVSRPGVVVARNLAVAASDGQVLVFIDDDVSIPRRTFLSAHASNYAHDTIAAVAGRITTPEQARAASSGAADGPRSYLPVPANRSPLQQAIWFDRTATQAQEVCAFCTCNGSVRRSAFLAIGGFDELFGGHSYGDDTDLALRLQQAGFRTVYDPAPVLVHRKVPMGGLRMSDRSTAVNWRATAEGFWLFVFRHGHRGMYRHLIYQHVLRKTVLLRQNLLHPWRQATVLAQTIRAVPSAFARRSSGPRSMFLPGSTR